MWIKIILISVISFFYSFAGITQTLRGKVFGETENGSEPLVGAAVIWINSQAGTFTDTDGSFELPADSVTDKRLVISIWGYRTDTVTVKNYAPVSVTLKIEVSTLEEITIRSDFDKPSTLPDAIKTEVIDQKELTKAACCDLAGCFETQATVQPVTTNILTNSKELRILGLSGIYNQVLIDGMPMIQGLTYTYGISAYPGTLVDNIYVAKGANSVLQGFESISGGINVILKDPDQSEKLYLNAYTNSFLEKHLNGNFSRKWKDWNTLLSVHTVQPSRQIERDDDHFLDIPLLTRYMIYNKWKYRNESNTGFSSIIGIRYLNEKRIGGQTAFTESLKGDTLVYGQLVGYHQPEIYIKSGFRINKKQRIALNTSGSLHDQNSYFGDIHYVGLQKNIYANLQYELNWRRHNFKTGISSRYLNIEENLSFLVSSSQRTYGGKYSKKEVIPGIFAENTFNWKGEKVILITGLRLDHHNRFGYFITPRSLLKYDLRKKSTIRVSAGTGFRTINLFSENINLLASSRDIIITEELKPERALNWGINYSEKIDGKIMYGTLSFEFYQTRFMNQIFPDYDTDQTKAYISNFEGTSISNGFQAEGSFHIFERINTKLAYTFLDVFRIVNGEKVVLPFNSKHKLMGSVSYEPVSEKWQFDLNFHWFGAQRLPQTDNNPEEFRRPDLSESYSTISLQFTKKWQKIELYGGCENIFDFRQIRPILGWQDPFGPYFDSSFAWGPTRGREFYAGIRYRIK